MPQRTNTDRAVNHRAVTVNTATHYQDVIHLPTEARS